MSIKELYRDDLDVSVFTATTPQDQGGRMTLVTGITIEKVVSFSAVVSNEIDSAIPPEFSAVPGHQYSVWFNSSGLNLQLNSSNSSSLLSKTFKVTVVHER